VNWSPRTVRKKEGIWSYKTEHLRTEHGGGGKGGGVSREKRQPRNLTEGKCVEEWVGKNEMQQ